MPTCDLQSDAVDTKILYSIIVCTYNRIADLLLTLPQILEYLDGRGELIVIDQSDQYEVNEYKSDLLKHSAGHRVSYWHSPTPSVPLAWNTAAQISKGEILIFLDDDVDLLDNVIEQHISIYDDAEIVGVAGSYYAGRMSNKWVASSKNGSATALAGAHMSFRRSTFMNCQAATWFIKSFAGVDWELAEIVGSAGKLAVGDDCVVFHRAPVDGGCGNQGDRGIDWYYGAYFNHTLWLLSRRFPDSFTRVPRHIYWLYKYLLPSRKILFTKDFLLHAVKNGVIDGYKDYRRYGGVRQTVCNKERLNLIVQSEHLH